MGSISGVLIYVVFTALFFYILYFVVRAAVRDGVRAARQGQGGPKSPS